MKIKKNGVQRQTAPAQAGLPRLHSRVVPGGGALSINPSPLINWYRANQRQLPWRRDKNPYFIWISEIMLQQTTVRVVIDYFERFIQKFPTVEKLANASTSDVTALWSGLGYYSRARNLHRAAQQIVTRGDFPKSRDELLELAGVGPYTAAAVASIAYNEEVPVVDGNVERVISRLFDISDEIKSKAAQETVQRHAHQLISGEPPSDHNQAMMELGATICTPQNPSCMLCPVAKQCQARRRGTIGLRPVKLKRKKSEPWTWQIKLLRHGGYIALTKNTTPWLKDMWVLPGVAAKSKTLKNFDFVHSITHHKIHVQIEELKIIGKRPQTHASQALKWVKKENIKNHGVSSVVKKVLQLKLEKES